MRPGCETRASVSAGVRKRKNVFLQQNSVSRASDVNLPIGGMHRRKLNWVFVTITSVLMVLFFFALAAAAEKNVLFVHTGKSNGPAVMILDRTFEAALTANSSDPIHLYNEYTDLWRFSTDEYQRALHDLFRQKYAGQHIDLVVVESPPALKFLLEYGDELFPGTPVIFCVMEGRLIESLQLKPNFNGVLAGLDFKKSLESALLLQPDTRNVIVVGGTSELDKSYLASAQRDFRAFEGRVEFTYLTDLSIEEIERRVAQPPPHAIVFNVVFYRDATGRSFPAVEAAARIARAANAPVYGIAEALVMPGGGVGGYLWSIEADATETARLARRILDGEKPQDIPIQVGDTNRYIFDWHQLKRWGISETGLPLGSVVRNRDLSFFERYKWYVLVVIALTLAEALLIAFLLLQRSRRAQAEEAIRDRLEFEKMLSELSASFLNLSAEDIDETIDRHLREVVKVTRVEGCSVFEFSGDYEEASIVHRYDTTGRVAPFSVVKFEQFPWYLNELRSGAVVKVRDINADLPEEAAAERKAAREVGIKSVLTVPIAISQTVTSAISVFTTESYCDWKDELETRLRLVGEIFVQAMLRKRTEEALRASEARVRRLIDSNIIGVIHTDGGGNVIDANGAFLEMVGYSQAELKAGSIRWADMTPAECLGLDEHGLEEAKTRGACTPYEKYYIRKDGSRVPVLLGYALLDATKDDYICFVLDLTENRLAEAALRESEDRYRDLVQHSHELICTHDLDGQVLSVNPWAGEVLGYDPEFLIGRNIRDCIPTESHGAVNEYLQAIRHDGFAKGLMQVKTATGERRLWEYDNTLRTEDVETPIVRGMAHDITDKKIAEQALRDSQAQVSGIVNSAMDAIITVDANQRVVLFNAAAEKMFRCSAQEAIRHPLERLIPAQFRVDHSSHIREFGETGVTTRAMAGARTIFGLRSDGEEFPLEASISQINVGGKKLFTVIMRDITERHRAEQELRNALSEVQRLKDQLHQENIYLQSEIALEHNFHEIVGESDELKYALFKIEQVAPTDSTVLLLGETGTGKELVARAIHSAGSRKHRPLVKINCATLPANLVESELFGHERGSFTGAHVRKIGRFEIANGATLFLDEIGELPLDLQAKLLRVLQEGEFERVGGGSTINVDVRIIAATNRDLKAEIVKNLFREDLWYRLSVFPITLPPLRQREGDIPLLVNHFIDKFNKKLGRNVTSISSATMKALQRYSWRGNVRELANVIERAVINSPGPTLQIVDKLDGEGSVAVSAANGAKRLIDVERNHILQVLNSTGWKIEGSSGAATVLGMKSSTLRTRLAKLGIHRPVSQGTAADRSR